MSVWIAGFCRAKFFEALLFPQPQKRHVLVEGEPTIAPSPDAPSLLTVVKNNVRTRKVSDRFGVLQWGFRLVTI